ncbi:MAG TPA: XRE family transcriptional regulator [Saprospiraceae bacterium]|nr:XRE family transcriptional regulator [Saprospiraceae bacterium]
MSIPVSKVIKNLPKARQKRIRAKADSYIREYESLKALRKVLGFTQDTLATRQGVKQVNISNLEKRTDMHISTLKKYVEAMGCELEITIRIPDKTQVRIENL